MSADTALRLAALLMVTTVAAVVVGLVLVSVLALAAGGTP